ncbi:hypothetical protein [Intrasporangium sp. YIM S08009]|uniref:hypothetical protein n=1 Tax=Intrasporangium zincisolvens TaxID=3080018 RepID=UPI002B05F877|nr:hypothetical protein [Intrasporangium sp. YIM S08009]
MHVRPDHLNTTIAWLFMAGSACFVVGSVPAYASATGSLADDVTYVVGSVFFTCASYCQLVQAQSPGTTVVDEVTQRRRVRARLVGWMPHDRAWLAAAAQFPGTLFFNISTTAALTHNATAAESDRYVWRPDLYGSVLFLVSSAFAVLAVSRRFLSVEPESLPWRIAWVNMLGSVLFMASALASYVVPSTDEVLDTRLAVAGTFFGAACFLIGAALMLPAWRRALSAAATPTP